MDGDEKFLAWLSGLVDGEGCFLINMRRFDTGNIIYCPHFILALRADDADILFEIADHLEIGRIYENKPTNTCPNATLRWVIASASDCLGLIAILDEFPLRTRKLQDYLLWRESVEVYNHKPVNKARMATLYERLQLVKKYNQELPEEPVPDIWQLALWEDNNTEE